MTEKNNISLKAKMGTRGFFRAFTLRGSRQNWRAIARNNAVRTVHPLPTWFDRYWMGRGQVTHSYTYWATYLTTWDRTEKENTDSIACQCPQRSSLFCMAVYVLFSSERIVLLRSFKERNVLLRSFFEFLATYETQKNDAFFCILFLRT